MPKLVKFANSDSCIAEDTYTFTCILAISPAGLFGAHHYFMDRCYFGLLYTFTLGLFGVGYIVDWFRFPTLLKRYEESDRSFKKRYLDDAYLLWFPLGLLGFHHFYLKRPVWGVMYMLTLGLFSIGWMVDCVRMSKLVENCNKEIDKQEQPPEQNNPNRGMATDYYMFNGGIDARAHISRQNRHNIEMATGNFKIFCIFIIHVSI